MTDFWFMMNWKGWEGKGLSFNLGNYSKIYVEKHEKSQSRWPLGSDMRSLQDLYIFGFIEKSLLIGMQFVESQVPPLHVCST